MKFWLATAFLDTNEMVDVARVADGLGYHGVFVSDHVFYPKDIRSPYPYSPDGAPIWSPDTAWPDPWVLIGAMAAATTQLHFGTNIDVPKYQFGIYGVIIVVVMLLRPQGLLPSSRRKRELQLGVHDEYEYDVEKA